MHRQNWYFKNPHKDARSQRLMQSGIAISSISPWPLERFNDAREGSHHYGFSAGVAMKTILPPALRAVGIEILGVHPSRRKLKDWWSKTATEKYIPRKLHVMEYRPRHRRLRIVKRWPWPAHDLTHVVSLVRRVWNSTSENAESDGHLLWFVFAKSWDRTKWRLTSVVKRR
jgi:hypothetical protein